MLIMVSWTTPKLRLSSFPSSSAPLSRRNMGRGLRLDSWAPSESRSAGASAMGVPFSGGSSATLGT